MKKKYTNVSLYKAISDIVSMLSGKSYRITQMMSSDDFTDDDVSNIKLLTINAAYKADINLNVSYVKITPVTMSNGSYNIFSENSVLRPYLYCKAIDMAVVNESTNDTLNDELYNASWVSIPDAIFSKFNVDAGQFQVLNVNNIAYLDYTPIHGALCYVDTDNNVLYCFGLDMNAFEDFDVINNILQLGNRYVSALFEISLFDSNDTLIQDSFDCFGDTANFMFSPIEDNIDTNELTVIQVNNPYCATANVIQAAAIPTIDLNGNYRYTVDFSNVAMSDTPQLLP